MAFNGPSQQRAENSGPSTTEPSHFVQAIGDKHKEDRAGTTKDGNASDPKQVEENAQQAKAEADAKAKVKADLEAKRIVDAERYDREMVQYELAKAVYHAATRVNQGRMLAEAAEADARAGRTRESERLMGRARARYQEVIDLYPDTDAAEDARQLLDGKYIPSRPLPPAALLPKGIKASDDEIVEKPKPKPPQSTESPFEPLPSGSIVIPSGISPKSVYVRGYSRHDGTYVEPHYRVTPETGKHR